MKARHLKLEHHTAIFERMYEAQEQLVETSKKKNSTLLFKFIFYFVLMALSYTGILFVENTFGFIASFILFGFSGMLLAFNFAHDFSHNTIFKGTKWNNRAFEILYALVGAHGATWKKRHVHSHHHAPNVLGHDTDLEITDLIRVIPESEHKAYHRFQYVYAPFMYMTYSLFWIFIKDFSVFYKSMDTESVLFKVSFWIQKLGYVGYLLVIPIVFSKQSAVWVICCFLVMHALQSVFLLFTFFMTHHVQTSQYPKTDTNGEIQTSWLMNQLQSSNDFYPFCKVANFIFGGFNNHIAHHLFPNVHHIYYPELNIELYQILRENGFEPNQTTYFGGAISHLRHLRVLSKP